MRRLLIPLITLAVLSGCAGSRPKDQASVSADVLFVEAQAEAKRHNYEDAAKLLERIRDEFPFSKYTVDAELLGADIAYQQEKYQEAAAAYRSFEDVHPTHPKAAYAVYRRGLAQMQLSRPEDRDQTATRAALEAFQKLLQAYGGGEYAKDARVRVVEARNRLAAHELYVARYYVRKERFDAAIGRLESVLRDYPDTSSKGEAEKLMATLKAPPSK
jgi:outer membrane protein assembly factor BamD